MRFKSKARASVVRSIILFTPFLVITLFGLGFFGNTVADEGLSGGGVVMLVIVSLVALLLAYQVIQSLRDAFASPVETIGEVDRSWTRKDMFLFKNSYVFVGPEVFRVPPEQHLDLSPGDTVKIVHLPHTGAVETIELVASES